jgi:hypothetical protein
MVATGLGRQPHVQDLARFLGLDADIVAEGLMLAAARDAITFGAAATAARTKRAYGSAA